MFFEISAYLSHILWGRCATPLWQPHRTLSSLVRVWLVNEEEKWMRLRGNVMFKRRMSTIHMTIESYSICCLWIIISEKFGMRVTIQAIITNRRVGKVEWVRDNKVNKKTLTVETTRDELRVAIHDNIVYIRNPCRIEDNGCMRVSREMPNSSQYFVYCNLKAS